MTEMNSDPATKRGRRAVRRFTDEQRAQMVEESYVAGVSVREVAARHDVSANQLSTWRSEFAKKQKNASTANTVRFAFYSVLQDTQLSQVANLAICTAIGGT